MKTSAILATSFCFLIQMSGFGQQAQSHKEEAISMVSQIYVEVSGEGDESVDWDKVRSFFDEDALIVLRTSREATSQFTVDEFIQDFLTFYQSPPQAGIDFWLLKRESDVWKVVAVTNEIVPPDGVLPGIFN